MIALVSAEHELSFVYYKGRQFAKAPRWWIEGI